MPFLKEKIARAKLLRNLQARKSKEGVKRRSSEEWSLQSEKSTSPNSPIKSQKKTETGSRKSSESEDGKATKNIAQNFGRAICTFAASSISIPYLLPILEEEKLSFCSFKQSIMATKKSINCLCDFREALWFIKLTLWNNKPWKEHSVWLERSLSNILVWTGSMQEKWNIGRPIWNIDLRCLEESETQSCLPI